jgi:hypothetical protein
MMADLGSPLGHASPCTLASPDVPTCSSIPGRLQRLFPLLGRSLPATFLKFFPSFPEHNTALFRDSGLALLLARWFSPWVLTSSYGPANENRAPFSTYLLFPARSLFCLLPVYLLVPAEIISSTLKMEVICSSETTVATQQTTWRHIPEDDILLCNSSAHFI